MPTTAQECEEDAAHPSAVIRQRAAVSPLCPPALLMVLAEDPNASVQERVVCHPACPPEAFVVFAGSGNYQIRITAAAHPNCPPAELDRLGDTGWDDSRNHRILKTVVANPRTPTPTLHRIERAAAMAYRAATTNWEALGFFELHAEAQAALALRG